MRVLTMFLVVAGCAWAYSPALAAANSQDAAKPLDACPAGQIQHDDGLCVPTKGARMGYDNGQGATPPSTAKPKVKKPKGDQQTPSPTPPGGNGQNSH